MRLPFLHPGPPSGDDHDGLSGGPCASTRLLVGGILWFCLCLGLSLCLASREGGAVLVAEDGQPVLATGDWLRHRDRLDDLMRQTLSRVMPGCRLLTMPGFFGTGGPALPCGRGRRSPASGPGPAGASVPGGPAYRP